MLETLLLLVVPLPQPLPQLAGTTVQRAPQAFDRASTQAELEAGPYTWERLTPGNTGVPGDYTHTIFLDAQDQPWVAGYIPFWEHGGMARFDGQHWETISNVDHPAIASPRFNDIVADAAGVLWIASDKGLLRYDPALGPKSLKRWHKGNSPIPGNQLVDLAFDPQGRLWIASQELGGSAAGGLVRHDPQSGQWTVWDASGGLPWSAEWPGWHWVDHVAVVPDADGGFTVWFHGAVGMATWRNGAFFYYGSSFGGSTKPVSLPSNDPVGPEGDLWIDTSSGLARRAPDGTYTLVGYPAGLSTEVARVVGVSGRRALLGTFYSDVFEWDGGWSYHSNWAGPGPGSGSHTYTLREDSQGNLWAGGIGGAARFEQGQWQRYRITSTGMLGYFMRELAFLPNGDVLMNGNAGPGVGGFTIFDGTDWTCVNDLNYGLGPQWGLPSDDVEALCVRASGTVAVAPAGGQGLYDWDGITFTQLVPQGYSVYDVAEDSLGRLWAAVGNAVMLVENGGFTLYTTSNSPLFGGDVPEVRRALEPGSVWLICQFGVIRTDGTTFVVYPRELMGLTLNSLGYHFTSGDLAADGTLWLGTGRGLYHFDPQTGFYDVRTPANSTLPSDDVDHVRVAPDGTVWCTTFDNVFPYPGGLTHFDGSFSETFRAEDSPLPHNQTAALEIRPTPGPAGGYEVWVGSASEGVTVVRGKPQLQQKP